MTDANAVRYFQDKLAFETSPRELVEALHAGENVTLVDVRRPEAYAKGHLPHAVSLPVAEASSAKSKIDTAGLVVVYDWGPASTESSRACLALAAQGYRVRELLGGFEYWSRLGLGVVGADGNTKRRASDPLVTSADKGWD